MTTYATKAATIGFHARGVPQAVVEEAVKRAVIRLCIETLVWVDVESFNSVANAEGYNVPVPANSMVHRVLSVSSGDRKLTPMLLGTAMEDPDKKDTTAENADFVMVRPNDTAVQIRPWPIIDNANQLIITACQLRPTEAATSYPDELEARYSNAIRIGALADLYERLVALQPEVPTHASMWAAYRNDRDMEYSRANREAMRVYRSRPVELITTPLF